MAMEAAVSRRLFTRAEYLRMAEAGILTRSDRVELIEGEILTMAPMGRRHWAFVTNLTRLLTLAVEGRALVAAQLPLALTHHTEPEPDVAVYRLREDVPYKEREACGDDALLVIEVAETSLRFDRTTKLRLYAAAGIPEYWIVDGNAEAVEVYRSPEGETYRETTCVEGDAVSPLAFPDVVLPLAAIFA